MNDSIGQVSSNLWRPGSATTVLGTTESLSLASFADLSPQTNAEHAFLSNNGPVNSESWKRNIPPKKTSASKLAQTLPPSPLSQMIPSGKPNHPVLPNGQPNKSFYTGQAEQLKNQIALSPKNEFARPRPFSSEELTELKQKNPLAHDRFVALPPKQQLGVTSSGPLEDVTMFIPKSPDAMSSVPSRLMPRAMPNNVEEVFSAKQPLKGNAQVLGTRQKGDDWYMFGGEVGERAKAKGKNGSKLPHGDAASTWFAPEEYLGAGKAGGGNGGGMGPKKVIDDVQGIMEGPWKGYLKGDQLKGREHGVQAVHSGPREDGFQTFMGQYSNVQGILGSISSVANSLQALASVAALAESLGDFGNLLGKLQDFSIPSSPGELITSLLTGSADGTQAGQTGVSTTTAAGVDGVVVTTGGAGAAAAGEALLNQMGKAEAGKGGSGNGSGSSDSVSKETTGGEGELGAENSNGENPDSESTDNQQDGANEEGQSNQNDAEPEKDENGLPIKPENSVEQAGKELTKHGEKVGPEYDDAKVKEAAANSELDRANSDLEAKRAELDAAQNKVDDLERQQTEAAKRAQNASEYGEGNRLGNEADGARSDLNAKQAEFDQANTRAQDASEASRAASEAVDDMTNPNVYKNAGDLLEKGGKAVGGAMDAKRAYDGYQEYNEAGARGDTKGQYSAVGGAVGDIGGGMGGAAIGAKIGAAAGGGICAVGGLVTGGASTAASPYCAAGGAIVGAGIGGYFGSTYSDQGGRALAEAIHDSPTDYQRSPNDYSYCFTASTPVLSKDNQLVPIVEIRPGDEVFALDGEQAVRGVVSRLTRATVPQGVSISVEGETIETTSKHPFYILDRGWTPASDICVGHQIVSTQGSRKVVAKDVIDNPLEVFNITVERYHNYFVGNSQLLVHNK